MRLAVSVVTVYFEHGPAAATMAAWIVEVMLMVGRGAAYFGGGGAPKCQETEMSAAA